MLGHVFVLLLKQELCQKPDSALIIVYNIGAIWLIRLCFIFDQYFVIVAGQLRGIGVEKHEMMAEPTSET